MLFASVAMGCGAGTCMRVCHEHLNCHPQQRNTYSYCPPVAACTQGKGGAARGQTCRPVQGRAAPQPGPDTQACDALPHRVPRGHHVLASAASQRPGMPAGQRAGCSVWAQHQGPLRWVRAVSCRRLPTCLMPAAGSAMSLDCSVIVTCATYV